MALPPGCSRQRGHLPRRLGTLNAVLTRYDDLFRDAEPKLSSSRLPIMPLLMTPLARTRRDGAAAPDLRSNGHNRPEGKAAPSAIKHLLPCDRYTRLMEVHIVL